MVISSLLVNANLAEPANTGTWITLAGVLFAAVCSVVGAILVSKTRGENATQHLASQDALSLLSGEVNSMGTELRVEIQGVGTKVDNHIGWHAGHEVGLSQAGSATIVNIRNKETA